MNENKIMETILNDDVFNSVMVCLDSLSLDELTQIKNHRTSLELTLISKSTPSSIDSTGNIIKKLEKLYNKIDNLIDVKK